MNVAQQPYTRGELLHELFRGCASLRPDAVALIHGEQRVGYRELDTVSDIFAAELRGRGVAPGVIVPVIMPRSVRLVVALLAVLKCGAAYTALDPRWPAERFGDLLAHIEPPVVISDVPVLQGEWSVCPAPVSCEAIESRPEPFASDIDGTAPCAVFFTSGTTGKPKGVLSPHRGTVRLFQDCLFAEFRAETVMPLAAAVPWDAFSLELWSVLINGGCSVIIDEPYLTPAGLRESIRRYGVNSLSLTASLFAMFVDEDLDAFHGLSQLFVGAERVSQVHVRRLMERHPSIRLVHCYGPAESTIFATTHQVTPADWERDAGIPLGTPVPNTGVYLWDDEQVRAQQQPGELVITGDGLACGYLADPESTGEKFVRLRLDGRDQLAYRTGDVGHIGADGLLYFDGRVDRQVKIRGHRIEPAEIERKANELSWIRQCAAVPMPDPDGGFRGIALFYRSEYSGDAMRELREHLAAGLPAYLVPRLYFPVPDFPLNDNGKLDTKALLARIDSASVAAGSATVPDEELPYGSVVAAAFGSVLGIPEVPFDVPFVELGGDSLGLGRLATRLSSALRIPVPLSTVTRHSTVLALTRWVQTAVHRPDSADAKSGSAQVVPLSPIQFFFTSRQQADPSSPSYHCLMAWWIDGAIDVDALAAALADLHLRHEPLRAAYRLTGPPHVDGPVAALTDVQERPQFTRIGTAADEVRAHSEVLAALNVPFDLAAGRVWRAAVAGSADTGRTLLGVAVHHVAFDGWSEAVFASELGQCYSARCAGVAPHFDDRAPSLAQLEAERRRQLGLSDVEVQRRYWRAQLHDIPALSIPVPTAEPPAQPLDARVYRLDAAILREVDELARRHRTTRFAVLFANYACALRTITGQSDFGIGVPIVKRETPQRVAALGCFIDMISVRVRLSRISAGADLIDELHTSVMNALAAQDVPFTELTKMGPPPEGGRTPLHQTMFALQNIERPVLNLTGCGTEFVHIPRQSAPFELITEVWPQSDDTALVEFTYRTERVTGDFVDKVAAEFLGALGAAPTLG